MAQELFREKEDLRLYSPQLPYVIHEGEFSRSVPADYADLARDYSLRETQVTSPGVLPSSTTAPSGSGGSTRRMPCGSGVDGDVHYTVDTTLAQGAYVIHARNFTLDAGKTLLPNKNDPGIIIYCTGTFTMGAGAKIKAWIGDRLVGGSGGVGNGGVGGYAARSTGFCLAFVNNVNMAATAEFGGGEDGEGGHNGGASSANGFGGAGLTGTLPLGLGDTYFRGHVTTTGAPVNGNYAVDHGAPATAGTKINLAAYTLNNWDVILKDVRQYLYVTGLGFATTPAAWFADPNLTFCYTPSSGCQGCDDGGNFGGRAIGGPAGASAGFFSDGKNGTGTPDPGTCPGGGKASTGGGGGGPGGWGGITAFVASGTVTSAGVLSAKGGNGGKGGDAFTNSSPGGAPAQPGEAAPGGNGGGLWYLGPKWTTHGGTFTAAGGTKGAQGIAYNGAPVPAAASDGTAGYSYPDEDAT